MPHPAHGIRALPGETLLADRARDFLAAGPADAPTLVRHVCQQAQTPAAIAERVIEELLRGRPEFERCADGRWRLASTPEPAAPVTGFELGLERAVAGAPAREAEPTPPPPLAGVPTFDEWLAQRAATAAAAPGEDAPQSRRGRRTTTASPTPAPAAAAFGGPVAAAPLHALSYVVVDVETTGGSPHAGHRITEIAAVVVRDGEVRDVYETLVNPQRAIPPMIMKLTGITMEMVATKRPFVDICPQVVSALSGHVFVAHNVNFDWRFVAAEVARATGQKLDGPRLCTVRLARKLLPQLRSRSLGYVADYYGADEFARDYFERRHGRERPWRHSAAGDAVATAHCLLRLLRDAAAAGVTTWGELEGLLASGTARARRRRTAMPAPVQRDTTS